MKLDFDKISNAAFLCEVADTLGEDFVNDNVVILSRMYAISRNLLFREGAIERMRNADRSHEI